MTTTYFVFNWVVGVVVVSSLFSSAQANPALEDDFLYCMQKGRCGLFNVCSFFLKSGQDEGRCYGSDCFNISGHIMRIENDMDYNITFHWDVLGESHKPRQINAERLVHIDAHAARYINTGKIGHHTVRLFLNDEPIDTAVASLDPCLTDGEACEYLLRICYGPDSVDPQCTEYARHCHGFERENEAARRECIPNCIATYYADIIQDVSKIDPHVLIRWIASKKGVINSHSITAASSTGNVGTDAGIIILSIIVVVELIIIVIMGCKWYVSSRRDSTMYKWLANAISERPDHNSKVPGSLASLNSVGERNVMRF